MGVASGVGAGIGSGLTLVAIKALGK